MNRRDVITVASALAKVVSGICSDCEAECKKHEMHSVCKECEKACHDCKELCDKVAAP